MLGKLFDLLFRKRPPSLPEKEEIPRYPPFPKGLPLIPPEELLSSHHEELVWPLLYAVNLDPDEAESLFVPVLLRYTAFVHLLPASETHHHRGAGGLLRHGLEVALGCVREMDSHYIFDTHRPPSERRRLAPRWRVAYAVAGLLHDVAKIYTDMRIVSSSGEVWNPLLASLYDWGRALSIERYFLYWKMERHKEHEAFLPYMAAKVLTPELVDWLSTLDDSVPKRLMPFFANRPGSLAQIVQKHDYESVEKDLKCGLIDLFPATPSPEHRILSAIKRLLDRRAWTINEPGTCIWHTTQGVFLVWPKAGLDIIEELRRSNQFVGIPKDPYELRALMYERGVLRRMEAGEDEYDEILLSPAPLGREGQAVYLSAVWIVQTGALFDPETFPKVSADILIPRDLDRKAENKSNPSPQNAVLEPEPSRSDADTALTPPEDPDSSGKPPPKASENRDSTDQGLSPQAGKNQNLPRTGKKSHPPQLHEGQETKDTGKTSSPPAQKKQRIEPENSEAGRMIRALAKAASAHPEWVRGDLLAHPELAEAAGLNVGACVRVLFEAGFLEPDPANRLRKVTLQEGRSWLKLKRGLLWLFEPAAPGVRPEPAPGEEQTAKPGHRPPESEGLSKNPAHTDQELLSLVQQKLGMTQGSLAKQLGISKTYLSLVTAGKRNFSQEIVGKLLEIIGQCPR